MVEKVLADYGRAEPREAVDLHFILQKEAGGDPGPVPKKDPESDLYRFALALARAEEFPA